jgi:hypothetical protein
VNHFKVVIKQTILLDKKPIYRESCLIPVLRTTFCVYIQILTTKDNYFTNWDKHPNLPEWRFLNNWWRLRSHLHFKRKLSVYWCTVVEIRHTGVSPRYQHISLLLLKSLVTISIYLKTYMARESTLRNQLPGRKHLILQCCSNAKAYSALKILHHLSSGAVVHFSSLTPQHLRSSGKRGALTQLRHIQH